MILLPSASLEPTKIHTALTFTLSPLPLISFKKKNKKNKGSAQQDGRGNLSGQVLHCRGVTHPQNWSSMRAIHRHARFGRGAQSWIRPALCWFLSFSSDGTEGWAHVRKNDKKDKRNKKKWTKKKKQPWDTAKRHQTHQWITQISPFLPG